MIVKICGITNIEDARHCFQVGADWIGVNLVSGPRRIEIELALEIIRELADPSRAVVLLGLDRAVENAVLKAIQAAGVRRLQLYGQMTASVHAELNARGFELILAEPIGGRSDIESLCTRFSDPNNPRPDYLLVDARVSGMLGGSGQRADWSALADARRRGELANWPALILAGGLNPGNVTEAIKFVGPCGVDVSSGVEESPGKKNPEKVEAFIRAVRAIQVS